jgi:hypothetical protein
VPDVIPANIDYLAIIEDLNRWGIRDYKIEAICGLGQGRISQVKSGWAKRMLYENAARLYNFWLDEAVKHADEGSRETSILQPLSATTT